LICVESASPVGLCAELDNSAILSCDPKSRQQLGSGLLPKL